MLRTDVGVLERDLVSSQRRVHDGDERLVEFARRLQRVLVLGAGEVVVRADLRIRAARGVLQPPGVLRPSTSLNGVDGDQLVPAERRRDVRAIGKRLHSLDGRIQTLEESHGGALQDIVDGGGDGELREADGVLADALDLAITSNVTRVIVLPRAVDLLVAEGGQLGGRERLGRAVAMAVEDICSQHGFGRVRCGEQRERGQGKSRLHGVVLYMDE